MAAHQALPSLGFSRQEHWSGLPFPSLVHESEKWKWSCSVVSWLLVIPWTAARQASPSMGFSRQEYWNGVPSPSPEEKLRYKHCSTVQQRVLDSMSYLRIILVGVKTVEGKLGNRTFRSDYQQPGKKELRVHPTSLWFLSFSTQRCQY